MDQIQDYRKLNQSFKKKLVFRIGIDAGFFSEYNNMLLTMHYCLVNRIRFVLNSRDANFAYRKGWNDYFQSFVQEENFRLHKYYHTRLAPPRINRIRDKLGWLIFKTWCKLKKIDYLTWQILPLARNFSETTIYEIPELNLKGTIKENCSVLSEMIWRFNPETKASIEKLKSRVSLNDEYLGIHIRRGDKAKETNLLPPEKYLATAEEISDLRTAYIATDDYSAFEYLSENFTDWKLFSSAREGKDNGYSQSDHEHKPPAEKKKELVRLFAEIEILAGASHFIGTFSSNIGIFISFRKNFQNCTGIDTGEWKI